MPADVPGVLRRLLTEDAGRPRLTWYGPDGERVELSAKVLDNWVAKTANLLVDELDAGPGSRVAVALPPHWRCVTWILAIWATGACAVVVPPGAAPPADADVLVAADSRLLAAPGPAARVAVALPALAMAYSGDLPSGVLDGASGVRAHGDVFVPFVYPVTGDLAWEASDARVTHGDLITAAVRAADEAGWPSGVRLLAAGAPQDIVRDVLGPLTRSGSVVLHHDLAGLDDDGVAALRAQESVTAP